MKKLRTLFLVLAVVLSSFVIISSKCNVSCEAPVITFNPNYDTASREPRQYISFDINIRGARNNIGTVIVSRSVNGITDPSVLTIKGINNKIKTIHYQDTVPENIEPDSKIIYTVIAGSDCKNTTVSTKTFTLTIKPSSFALDPLIFLYETSIYPRIFSRFSPLALNNPAIKLVLSPLFCNRFATDPNDEKDIIDSSMNSGGSFAANLRWCSGNGSKFVKSQSVDWDKNYLSQEMIINAYKAGTPSDIITPGVGDFYIMKIKNGNRYAVVKIRHIYDDPISDNDFVLFSYFMAQF